MSASVHGERHQFVSANGTQKCATCGEDWNEAQHGGPTQHAHIPPGPVVCTVCNTPKYTCLVTCLDCRAEGRGANRVFLTEQELLTLLNDGPKLGETVEEQIASVLLARVGMALLSPLEREVIEAALEYEEPSRAYVAQAKRFDDACNALRDAREGSAP
jgi:hypothetical protein